MVNLLHDHSTLFYDEISNKYTVRVSKGAFVQDLTPAGIFQARMDMNVLPDDRVTAKNFYRKEPITLDNLSFRAWVDGAPTKDFIIQHEYDSNIELALPVKTSSPVHRARYEYRPSVFQWGSWFQREVRGKTGRLSICLVFPQGAVEMNGSCLRGGDEISLPGAVRHRRLFGRDVWWWTIDEPGVLDRYRFRWRFFDKRDEKIRDRITSEYGDFGKLGFELDDDGSTAVWFGSHLTFSTTQAQIMQQLFDNSRKFRKIRQDAVFAAIDSRSKRIRDVFRRHAAYGSLVKVENGFVFLDVSEEAHQFYLKKTGVT